MLTAIAPALGLILVAYLLGSVPTGYLAGQILGGFDIRDRGSGSTGTTNVLRLLGKGPAILVLAVDVLKGSAAVAVARLGWLAWLNLASAQFPDQAALLSSATAAGATESLIALAALAAVLGHSAPVWLGFRGGKSVATGLGTLAAMAWPVALGALLGFGLCLALFRIVSLASLVAACLAIALPFALGIALPYQLFGLAGGIYVIWRHRSNISRLLAGLEPKIGQSAPAVPASSSKQSV
ncbi:MAG: glycerol-3-phosphate 1-O-acyltransferase PlsY [Synechococcales cyanobacterium RM1_1_8]|nr:glycerol-3-phosphate 1-O-acyltransferase PlsY [Synechococcales cyanobacterium RM1_1_8]